MLGSFDCRVSEPQNRFALLLETLLEQIAPAGKQRGSWPAGDDALSTTPDTHADTARETPSQGIFIGWLALGLFAFAVLVALVGLLAGLTHGAG